MCAVRRGIQGFVGNGFCGEIMFQRIPMFKQVILAGADGIAPGTAFIVRCRIVAIRRSMQGCVGNGFYSKAMPQSNTHFKQIRFVRAGSTARGTALVIPYRVGAVCRCIQSFVRDQLGGKGMCFFCTAVSTLVGLLIVCHIVMYLFADLSIVVIGHAAGGLIYLLAARYRRCIRANGLPPGISQQVCNLAAGKLSCGFTALTIVRIG